MDIYVSNLPYQVGDSELRSQFARFGTVAKAAVIKDRETGESRGFGFVEMPDSEAARKAIATLNGVQLQGRAVSVSEARPRSSMPDSGVANRSERRPAPSPVSVARPVPRPPVRPPVSRPAPGWRDDGDAADVDSRGSDSERPLDQEEAARKLARDSAIRTKNAARSRRKPSPYDDGFRSKAPRVPGAKRNGHIDGDDDDIEDFGVRIR